MKILSFQILRTLCYSSKLIGGLANNPTLAKRMATFSSKMSGTRAVLRLLDDLPMLKYNLEYGFGSEVTNNKKSKQCKNDYFIIIF